MKEIQTFNNYIDEFVDWVTGEDTSSNETEQKQRASSTGGLPVSGGSIRELLQTRLKKPFVYYEDVQNGLYRLFSSEATRDKWIRMNNPEGSEYDPESSAKLELFNFVRPSDLVMTYTGLDPNPKYIINGDTQSSAANLQYNVYLSKEQGGVTTYEDDSFTVTYKIIDSNGVENVWSEEKSMIYINSSTKVTKNIYKYLTIGQNIVNVTMKATNSSAKNSITFPVYLIDFALESTFDYSAHWDPAKTIDVPVSIRRSDTNLTLQVDVYVDKTASSPGIHAGTWTVNSNETNPTKTFHLENNYASNIQSLDHIKHTMTITASLYNTESGEHHYSNVLYYDFVVASDTIGIINKFVTTGYSIPYNKMNVDDATNRIIITGEQYEPITLNWAYYTDRSTTEQTADIEWAIKIVDDGVTTYTPITTVEGKNYYKGEPLKFIPDFNTESLVGTQLVAMSNGNVIDAFPISVSASSLTISEIGGYSLKLQAYGRSNQSPDKAEWEDTANNVTTTFTNILFDDNSGWNDNSFVTYGAGKYATVNYCPFATSDDIAGNGKTIEIDFKPEKVTNEGDVLITIGDPTKGCIKITTNEAALYEGNTKVIHTNYKANERIKLAFVFNPVTPGSPDSNLVYIINNGTLERAKGYGTASSYRSDNGIIKIGDSDSGVRVYNIRAYDKPLSYDEELSNFIYDSDNKAEIINRNDIFTSSVIDYTKVKNKIDTVVITGNLDPILTQGTLKDESECTVNFKRECITDSSKTFDVVNGMIRKHGQSTLNYPITSMKIWTNKAKEDDVTTTINLSEQQRAEGYNKNRYVMKTGSIPANKFVLQANYADSSGVHNGALLRLINDTWYNAVDSNGRHFLRTAPQLFASGEKLIHNDPNLGEDGTWIEGTGVGIALNKTWADITNRKFPYNIRCAADSFPCAVFYKNGDQDGYHFLGQYVFMDDKKSDYTYGERSIYYFGNGSDPFVLKTENTKNGVNGKQDTAANRVWDNKDVLRIEVVLPNTTLTSYMNFSVVDGGTTHSCTDIKYDSKGNPDHYYWEDYFEMIYPDEDDIADEDKKNGMDKYNQNSKFVQKATPFINFLKWITDCKNNYDKATSWWNAGMYSSTQQAFQATANRHLDLHKLAAYYIFFLRFGLVDSVERNAQLKTYDGQHWHYEPWDMDIALGNTNQGALVLNPPINRSSLEPGTTTYAYSGRSTTTSNVLWDCLEAWEYWSDTIVPEVAQSLYDAGLSYNNIMKIMDSGYAEAWSESMYNDSGYFKYIQSGGADWLAWLQGSRTSHRHWWVSTSMNYYDARWSCGSFNEHRVRLFADKAINTVGTDIVTIKPTSDTYFKIAQQEGRTSLGVQPATRLVPAEFDISTYAFSAKDPSYIYGGTFIEEIDISCFAEKLKAVDFSLCYDGVLGAPIKKINIGIPYTVDSATQYTGKVSGTQLRLTGYDSTTGYDAFANLQVLDITGQSTITSTQELLATRNRKNITDIYAIGSGLTSFMSSTTGNVFNTLKLPGITTTTHSGEADEVVGFTTLTMQNSSWNTIEFWNTTKSGDIQYITDEHGDTAYGDDNLPILAPNNATFTKTTIPSTLSTVQFRGSTASNECAGQFLLDWIDSIDASLPVGHTEQDLYDALANKTFEAENINWGVPGQSISISYNTLARIAHMNNGNNSGGVIRGYIMISDSTALTSTQLAKITEWFGPSVFSKSSRNSNLVVDQATTYVRIAATTGVFTQGADICLKEGDSATLMATKFMLSETDQSEYTWSMVLGQVGSMSDQDEVNSVKLVQGDDGLIYLQSIKAGIYGDYYVTICALKSGMAPEYLTIKIIGSILPDHIEIGTQQKAVANARPFYLNDQLGTQMPELTGKIRNVSDNSIREAFVLGQAGQKVEFYPIIVDGATPSNAPVTAIRYKIGSLLSQLTNASELSGIEDIIENRVDDGTLFYTKSATNNGIVLGVSQLPLQLTVYELTVNVTVGLRIYSKTIDIIILNDDHVLHTSSTSASVQQALNALHQSLFGNSINGYYKSDLINLCGTLDFTPYTSGLLHINDTDGNLLFTHLINITSMDLTGCNLVTTSDITSSGAFPAMPKLQTLSLKDCTSLTGTIDFSACANMTSLDLRGTVVSPIFTNNQSLIQTLKLGTPTSVNIQNPTQLTPSGVTVADSTSITSVDLVNQPNCASFTMFAKIMNLI